MHRHSIRNSEITTSAIEGISVDEFHHLLEIGVEDIALEIPEFQVSGIHLSVGSLHAMPLRRRYPGILFVVNLEGMPFLRRDFSQGSSRIRMVLHSYHSPLLDFLGHGLPTRIPAEL